ncbi:MAG: prolyl oligopeptidase family serine peptidase [Acidimicrobiales bacterium]
MATVAPFGTWSSPVTLDLLVEDVVQVTFPLAGPDNEVYWLERRPSEGGRQVIVRRGSDGSRSDLFPGFNVRTLVHEYGGLPYALRGPTLYFTRLEDQRLYQGVAGEDPVPITPEATEAITDRYAAPVVSPDGKHLYCVRERHIAGDREGPGSTAGEAASAVVNEVVVVETDGSSEPRIIASGHDFYSHVAISRDGGRLVFVSWDHPNMPWDGTELFEVELATGSSRFVAGGIAESVTQPKYSGDGRLMFISDRTGWWNLYSSEEKPGGEVTALAPMKADLGRPDWIFGYSSYVVLEDGSVVGAWSKDGFHHLGVLRPGSSSFEELTTEFQAFEYLSPAGSPASVLAVAGSSSEAARAVRLTLKAAVPETGNAQTEHESPLVGDRTSEVRLEVLRESRPATLDRRYLSLAEPIEFPSGSIDGSDARLSAHALYYPPLNPDYEAPEGELPPLIVRAHGGPTSAASPLLDYPTQFWTSRGLAVVDVNYGGSTGYGREYRERLKGHWGEVDVEDCISAALYLAGTGRADKDRLAIQGGSAGGFTTLCAATFRRVFAVGASYFGVADPRGFAEKTHKFEASYLEGLIGPLPAAEALYKERSPLFHTDQLETPLILFQGLADKIVPPSQAEAMAAALAEKGLPFAYITYEGEQHGFAKAENIKRTAEAELYFYGRVLGFDPAGELDPVEIENAHALKRQC